jgi:hypothetical protein
MEFITGGRLGFIPSGRENVGYHRGCTKAKKDKKKKVGLGAKEEEGRGERAALKTKSIVGCVCLGS